MSNRQGAGSQERRAYSRKHGTFDNIGGKEQENGED